MEGYKPQLSRKPSTKRPPPVIKQTKGSLLRIIKSNPLIAIDQKTKQDLGITDSELKQLGHVGVVRETLSLNPNYVCNAWNGVAVKKNVPTNNILSKPNTYKENKGRTNNVRNLQQRFHGKPSSSAATASNLQFQHDVIQDVGSSKNLTIIRSKPSISNVIEEKALKTNNIEVVEILEVQPPISEHIENVVNKENIPEKTTEFLEYRQPVAIIDTPECSVKKEEALVKLSAKEAVIDLLRLIQQGYQSEKCSEWLNMLKQKCPDIEEEPPYWHCRAALEECSQNLQSALICYKTAVLKAAEVQNADNSLDQLLEKFSLLNIDYGDNPKEQGNKGELKDINNAFASTIIQYAIHEKGDKKKLDDVYKGIVTPVRRSTRLLSRQSETPRIKVCSTLKEIGEPENFDFKSNNFLSVRYN